MYRQELNCFNNGGSVLLLLCTGLLTTCLSLVFIFTNQVYIDSSISSKYQQSLLGVSFIFHGLFIMLLVNSKINRMDALNKQPQNPPKKSITFKNKPNKILKPKLTKPKPDKDTKIKSNLAAIQQHKSNIRDTLKLAAEQQQHLQITEIHIDRKHTKNADDDFGNQSEVVSNKSSKNTYYSYGIEARDSEA